MMTILEYLYMETKVVITVSDVPVCSISASDIHWFLNPLSSLQCSPQS
jgi:hypothetical protein